MKNNDLKELKRILNYALLTYYENQSECNLTYLIDVLITLNDLNCTDIDISMIYLLLVLYTKDKNCFPILVQTYLSSLFHTGVKKSLNLKNHLIEKELDEITKRLNATSSIYSNI